MDDSVRIAQRIAYLGIALLMLVGCDTKSVEPNRAQAFVDSLRTVGLADTIPLRLDVTDVAKSEDGRLTLRPVLRNTGERALTVIHGTGSFDVILFRDNEEVYPRLGHLAVLDDRLEGVVPPGGTYSPAKHDGPLVYGFKPDGRYQLVAVAIIHIGMDYFEYLDEDVRYRAELEDRWLVSDVVEISL